MPQAWSYSLRISTAGKRGEILSSHRIRASLALIAALLVAAIVEFIFIYLASLNISDGAIGPPLSKAFSATFMYGLPLAAAAVAASEYLRLRRWPLYVAAGIAVAFAAAYLATLSEPMTSYVFAGGLLTPLGLIVTGAASALLYWFVAGRRAGWRGDDIETHDALATRAFLRASENHAGVKTCKQCVALWAGASALAFALFAWVSIDALGLRDRLVADAAYEARAALKVSGHGWAQFDIAGARGTIDGSAPDELEKRMAHDIIREALYAVTGFPGVLSAIDDKAVAQVEMAAVNQKLAEAQQREREAQLVIDEARRTAEAARDAASPLPQLVPEPATAALNERAMQPDQSETADAPAVVAESITSLDPTSAQPPQASEAHEQAVAAVDVVAPSAEQVGASVVERTTSCTDQDVALVDSSRISFEPQSFDLTASFQRDLTRLAASIQSCMHQAVLVTGHVDANADTLFNPALSLQRAEAVRDALIARGVSAARIVTKTVPAGFNGSTDASTDDRRNFRLTALKFIDGTELSRDVAQGPDERASNCESDLSEIMSQSIIHFPIASARVSDESAGLIGKLAVAIQNCGSVIVTVEGHTDKIGSLERNQQLSIARATAVRTALASAGADPTRLASRGFAATRPLAEDETAEAYALNRRIEFKVSGKFTTANTGGP